jgi:hypothetical protein
MSFARKSPGTFIGYDTVARWKARAWGLVAYLVVLAGVAGIVLFAVRYQPVSSANFASGSGTESGPNMLRLYYTSGGTFSFGFMLVNDGPVPLKIQRIQLTGQDELLIPVRLETATKRYGGSLGVGDPDLEKFVTFTLDGNDRRWIVVRTRFANCGRFEADAFETYTQFEVTYEVLGFTKHAWVSLPKDIRVDSPPDYACPARAA